MKIKFFIFLLSVVIIVTPLGCLEYKKLPASNETRITTPISTPNITEQKLIVYNETKYLKINDTFETWSRGYWSNLSYKQSYFRIITNYSEWNAFLDNQGYIAEGGPMRLEGELFPGINTIPQKIEPTDFNNYFIIAGMMGYQNKQSPEIEIKNIDRLNDAVNVTVRMYKPSYGNMVESAPYHIVIVKRDLLPKRNSTFVFISTEGNELGKLTWSE